jgi:hypothetical protein
VPAWPAPMRGSACVRTTGLGGEPPFRFANQDATKQAKLSKRHLQIPVCAVWGETLRTAGGTKFPRGLPPAPKRISDVAATETGPWQSVRRR